MEITGNQFHILRKIKKSNKKREAEFRSVFFGTGYDYHAAIEYLSKFGLLEAEDKAGLIYFSLSEKGKEFLQEKEAREVKTFNESFVVHGFDFALLEFLYKNEEPIRLEDISEEIINSAPTFGNSMKDLKFLYSVKRLQNYINNNRNKFSLTPIGKIHFENKVAAIQGNENKENLEMQRLRGDVERLTNDLVDYPRIKWERKFSIFLNFVLAIIAILALLVECNKSQP